MMLDDQSMSHSHPQPTSQFVPDTLLAKRMLSQDESALALLIERYTTKLYGLAKRTLGELATHEDIEEILSDSFLRAWYSASSYDEGVASVSTWLGSIVVYNSLSKRKQILRLYRLLASLLKQDEPSQERAAGTEQMTQAEISLKLRVSLDQLLLVSPQDAELIRRRFFDDLTPSVIARELGVSAGLIRVRLYRAIHKLRQLMLAQVP